MYLRLPHQITSEKQKLLTSVEKKSAGLRSMHTGMHMFIRLMMETTSHRFLARGVINGEYVPCGCDGQVDMTKFRKTTNGRNGNFEVFLRFLDARGDPGWHFCSGNRGRKFAWNPQCSPLPPSDGWKVPANGPVHSSLLVQTVTQNSPELENLPGQYSWMLELQQEMDSENWEKVYLARYFKAA